MQNHPGPDGIPFPYGFLFKIWSLEDGANSSPVSPPHRAELVSGGSRKRSGRREEPGSQKWKGGDEKWDKAQRETMTAASFIQFNKCLLNTSWAPGTFLGTAGLAKQEK